MFIFIFGWLFFFWRPTTSESDVDGATWVQFCGWSCWSSWLLLSLLFVCGCRCCCCEKAGV